MRFLEKIRVTFYIKNLQIFEQEYISRNLQLSIVINARAKLRRY